MPLYFVCSLEGVTHGLYLIWLTTHRGIPALAAASAIAAGDFVLFALEIPTGVLADRLGARRSLMCGSVLQAIGIASFWQARSVAAVVVAVIAIAAGDAFRHGADEALVHRSCAALRRPETFGPTLARMQARALAAMVAMTALGGWLATHVGFDVAWALDLGLSIVALGLAAATTEVAPAATADIAHAEEPNPQAAPPSLRALLVSRCPWRLILPGAIVGAVASVAQLMAQTTPGRSLGADLIAFAIAGGLALEALGAALVARGLVATRRRSLAIAAVTAVCGLGCVALSRPGPMLVGILAVFLASGVAPAVRSALLQARAHEDERATVASVAGAVDTLVEVVALPLAAWLLQRAAR